MPVIRKIDNMNAPELDVYARLNEPQLKHFLEPEEGYFVAETMNVAERTLLAGYEPVSFLAEERLVPDLTRMLERICKESICREDTCSENICSEDICSEDNCSESSCSKDTCSKDTCSENICSKDTCSKDTCSENICIEGHAAWFDRLPVYTAPLDVLIGITGYNLTRGILGLMRRRPLPSPAQICREASRIAVLENVGNPTNIGAIFRSAAALGMDAVLLTAGCCDPLYRRSVRVSMGTVFQIPWTFLPEGHTQVLRYINQKEGIYRKEDALYSRYWPVTGMAKLKEMGFETVSLALTDRAVPIDDPSIPAGAKLAVILGNEAYGLDDETIRLSDHTAIIPMSHGVDSLNVAAASAVAFWQLGRH